MRLVLAKNAQAAVVVVVVVVVTVAVAVAAAAVTVAAVVVVAVVMIVADPVANTAVTVADATKPTFIRFSLQAFGLHQTPVLRFELPPSATFRHPLASVQLTSKYSMKKVLLTALLLATGFSAIQAQNPIAPTNQKIAAFQRKTTKAVSADYLLFLPEGYGKDAKKKWPLMLFLHGAGERGNNVTKVAAHGPPLIVQTKANFPFIVVSPQCPEGARWDNDVLLALLDEVNATYAIDAERVYLTGLSMGGYGSWSLGLTYPDIFAAIAPICGGGDSLKVLLADPKKVASLKTLPVWAFHGGKDNVVKPEESQRMVDALRKIGNEAKLTMYPETGHDSWKEAYANEDLYSWFLSHKRSGA